MKRKIALITTLAATAAIALTGCSESRNSLKLTGTGISAEADGEIKNNETKKKTEEETTKRKTEKETEEETTKKKTEKETEEETTKKKNEKETEEQTTNKTEKETKKSDNKNSQGQGSSKYGDTYTYYGGDFTITLPETWTDVSASMAGELGVDAVFAHYSTGLNGYSENINVVVQDISSYNMDLDMYTELSKSQYAAMDEYNVTDIKEDVINGIEVRRVELDASVQGVSCYCQQILAVENKKAYIFTFTADYEDKDDIMDEVEFIFDSIFID